MPRPLLDLWQAGVAAVRGGPAVRAALPDLAAPPTRIIAVGKAACHMARPAMEAFSGVPTLIVTKHGHGTDLPGPATLIESGHPIPDAASLRAGSALVQAVADCAPGDHLLLLVSGGASALAERLPEGMTLDDWRAETERLIASGADIHAINTRRREISGIKGGKLLDHFTGACVTTLAISDVEGDAIGVIGSGIGAAPVRHDFEFDAHIVASNAIARAAVERKADAPVIRNKECLYGNVQTLAPKLAHCIRNGPQGIHILGGEPTVQLPPHPGRGGRNQALALLLAREIAGRHDLQILVAGTDGTDGPTPDAGGIVDGTTWDDSAADALVRADAGSFLADRDALVTTGPTGTNVMDLMVARRISG